MALIKNGSTFQDGKYIVKSVNGTNADSSGNVALNVVSNTAGATNTSEQLFLVGAEMQTANPQTYTHETAYIGIDGCLYSGNNKVSVEGHTHAAANITAGTFGGRMQANASSAGTLSNAQVRNITISTTDLTAGTSALATGALYFVYE